MEKKYENHTNDKVSISFIIKSTINSLKYQSLNIKQLKITYLTNYLSSIASSVYQWVVKVPYAILIGRVEKNVLRTEKPEFREMLAGLPTLHGM